jgi:hypothetical protein
MNGPILVHPLVDVFEEIEGEPLAQAVAIGPDDRAVLRPCLLQLGGGCMSETVASVLAVESAIEEENARRQRVRQVILNRVEDPLAVRAEAAERHAERKAQMIGRRLRIVLGLVGRQRLADGAVDSHLRPLLSVTPARPARVTKLD